MDKVKNHNYDYDLVVIGGGSGGLACSKAAARLGRKVSFIQINFKIIDSLNNVFNFKWIIKLHLVIIKNKTL